MTDKELIKQELERRIKSMNSCPFKTAELGSEKFDEGELYAYKQILQFIDSFPEPSSEDLEEEKNEQDNKYSVPNISDKHEPSKEAYQEISRIMNRRRPYCSSDFKKQTFIPDLD